MEYYWNFSDEGLRKKGFYPFGRIGLLVLGVPAHDFKVLSRFFYNEIERTVKEANPNLKDIESVSIHYKSNKLGLASKLERVSFGVNGKCEEDQHFYIVQPLNKSEMEPIELSKKRILDLLKIRVN